MCIRDRIWTVLGEFGTQVNPTYGGTPGPVHNQIPQPDRTVDNTTIWSPDFTRAYYEHMLFSETPGDISMRNFYLEQSSNRYTVNGHVEDWAQLPFNCLLYTSTPTSRRRSMAPWPARSSTRGRTCLLYTSRCV